MSACETHHLFSFVGFAALNPRYELTNFKQVVKDKPVRIHPIVSQLVDPAVLEKMKVRPVGEVEEKTGGADKA